MYAVERLAAHKSVKRLDPEPKLADSKGALAPEAPRAESLDLRRVEVLGP